MTRTVLDEVKELEERLRRAELGPDPSVFEELLDDNLVIVAEDGTPFLAKQKIVQAHHPDRSAGFTRVDLKDVRIVEHGSAAVVTCTCTFEGAHGSVTLKFMRVWVRKDGQWRIVAGSVAK